MNEILINILVFLIFLIQLLILFVNKINIFIILTFFIFLITSAVFFLLNLKLTAVLYLIVYAGAVIILIVISAKSINLEEKIRFNIKRFFPLISALIFTLIAGITISKLPQIYSSDSNISYSDYQLLSNLFNKNFILIEIISLTLIAAIAGIINIMKESDDEI